MKVGILVEKLFGDWGGGRRGGDRSVGGGVDHGGEAVGITGKGITNSWGGGGGGVLLASGELMGAAIDGGGAAGRACATLTLSHDTV